MTELKQKDIEKIAESVETAIKKKYKRKFYASIVGLGIAFTVIAWFVSFVGTDFIKSSIADKLVARIADGDFKNEIISSVSETLMAPSNVIIDEIMMNKTKSDELLKNLILEHDSLINATTNEFERTLEVLKKIRGSN